MTLKTAKYNEFSEIFSKLSEDSQDKLVKIAYQLLKTHQYAQKGTGEPEKIPQSTNCCMKN